MKPKYIGAAVAVLSLFAPVAAVAALLTDITVFSANSEGNNWNSLIWNTQGQPPDTPNRWNLYVTQDPISDATPTFVNGFNDTRTQVSLPLGLGDNTFSIYGDGVNVTFDPLQHFVLNLYFNGVQSTPGLSGVQNLSNSNLMPAGHPNGLDILGNSGHQEAGSLSALVGNQPISLTAFSWITDGQRDVVHPDWANDPIYSNGNGRLDYYGTFTLTVRSVPEPGTLALLAFGLAGLAVSRTSRWSSGV